MLFLIWSTRICAVKLYEVRRSLCLNIKIHYMKVILLELSLKFFQQNRTLYNWYKVLQSSGQSVKLFLIGKPLSTVVQVFSVIYIIFSNTSYLHYCMPGIVCRECIFEPFTHVNINSCPKCNIDLGFNPMKKLRYCLFPSLFSCYSAILLNQLVGHSCWCINVASFHVCVEVSTFRI